MTPHSALRLRPTTASRMTTLAPSSVRLLSRATLPDIWRRGAADVRSGHVCRWCVNFALHKYSADCAGCEQRIIHFATGLSLAFATRYLILNSFQAFGQTWHDT